MRLSTKALSRKSSVKKMDDSIPGFLILYDKNWKGAEVQVEKLQVTWENPDQ